MKQFFGMAIAIALTGCATEPPMTAEQREQRRQAIAAALQSGALNLRTNQQVYQMPVPRTINCTSQAVYNTVQTTCR
ncbi:MAG: hypothetical protein NDI95_15535 [Acidovorax soli]|uniref:hypothetical protein n=1 Tax=Acidovorax soli TaxID=592050 RepID=UPI0026F0CDF9|nr:hypothetical protein [Acidovorax soli]MCM2348024.1 hypothetical protein [Acidovorax soli]